MLEEFEHDISELSIVPARGGVFEVVVDGELVYSKKATGRHADYAEVLKKLRNR